MLNNILDEISIQDLAEMLKHYAHQDELSSDEGSSHKTKEPNQPQMVLAADPFKPVQTSKSANLKLEDPTAFCHEEEAQSKLNKLLNEKISKQSAIMKN